ncbi:MAG: YcnI family protein [Microthrixaceae bacterium]
MLFNAKSPAVPRAHKRVGLGRRVAVGATVAVGGVAMLSGVASAHITPQDPEGPAGGYMTTAFKVGHGCEGSPTTKVEIKIPDGVLSVAPQPVDGWELTTTKKTLDPPIDSNGTKVTETVGTVTWAGGNLPADQLQMFWLSMKLPDGKAGDVLSFPVVQTCEAGETDWIEIAKPGEAEPEHPAPTITLTAATDDHHGSSADDSVSNDSTDSSATESATEGSTEATSSKSDSDDDSNGNGLAIGGIVLGALGLAAGGAAFAKASKKS